MAKVEICIPNDIADQIFKAKEEKTLNRRTLLRILKKVILKDDFRIEITEMRRMCGFSGNHFDNQQY